MYHAYHARPFHLALVKALRPWPLGPLLLPLQCTGGVLAGRGLVYPRGAAKLRRAAVLAVQVLHILKESTDAPEKDMK
jgi:hypothetical protein